MNPIVMALPGSEALARVLAAELDGETGALACRQFPDRETLVRLDADVRGRSVVLAASLDRADDKTLPLLFAADAARDLGAACVVLAAPYLGYMRQDARFHPGEAITSRTFAALLSRSLDGLATVDPHLHRYRSLDEIYTIPSRVVRSAPAIAQWIRDNVPDPVLVGPDSESEQWVADVAGRCGAPWTVLQKTRRGDRDVEVSLPDATQWRQRTPVLVDDIVSSARTMIEAAAGLRLCGMPPPVCIGVHAVFAAGAYEELLASGVARVVTCDTVPHPSNGIPVVPALAAGVRELLAAGTAPQPLP